MKPRPDEFYGKLLLAVSGGSLYYRLIVFYCFNYPP